MDGKDEKEALSDMLARDRIHQSLVRDLLGPESPDEELEQSPGSRYLVGMLAPSGTRLEVTEDESIDTASGDDQVDPGVAANKALDPSAIGISLLVEKGCEAITVEAGWGEYSQVQASQSEDLDSQGGGASGGVNASQVSQSKGQPEVGDTRRTRAPKGLWQRAQRDETVELSTAPTNGYKVATIGEDVSLYWYSRQLGDAVVLSVFLSNERTNPQKGRASDELWLFQPTLAVSTNTESIIGRRIPRDTADPDPDVASADLLYRDFHEFATGHGVSVGWAAANDAGFRTDRVWTEVIPSVEVPVVTHAGTQDFTSPEMEVLASANAEEIHRMLSPLLTSYERWLSDQRDEVDSDVEAPNAEVAREHLVLCGRALERMREGLALIKTDRDIREAFHFANRIMAMQMKRGMHVKTLRSGSGSGPDPEAPTWRPFQIGFILQCLPGIVDPEHGDRGVADLLWFPTGGGKTEAYLGLTALVLALRRLRRAGDTPVDCGGTAVIMRYTLRLLTLQQFQRALTMLCACEVVRKTDESRWGELPFTVGLWVGSGVTPNSFESSKEALEHLDKGRKVYKENPYQVVYCPWCAEDLSSTDYKPDEDRTRTLIFCPNSECDFSAARSSLGLPFLIVDEEIYRNPPALLLATVDKFALMPWKGEIQSLFGRVDRYCPRHGFLSAAETHANGHHSTDQFGKTQVERLDRNLPPPELIIQDELHLISGPLGTLVGTYEVAVNKLCQAGEQLLTGAKVIASTATIRRARLQVEALFDRPVRVFPPLGLTSEESFFASKVDPEETPGRRYVGVYAPGRSVKTALVRVYAALLSRAEAEFKARGTDEEESYMTLVGYFNSIRELGGAKRLVEDDVPARLKVLSRRDFGPNRKLYETMELTARVSSNEIPERLKRLERQFHSPESGKFPVDVLLASNMLSVGVDIGRLGLMVMNGQPKTTAEYIQASSRVGREYPGLIITVYNWSRPRDTSHYETFRHYHETFYRHVEATSVTPFSARARDRALPAVLASYVRLASDELAREGGAADFKTGNALAKEIVNEILERVTQTTEVEAIREDARQQLSELVREWADLAMDRDHPLVYTPRGLGPREKERMSLLKAIETPTGRGAWAASRSLREVETEVDVFLYEDPS